MNLSEEERVERRRAGYRRAFRRRKLEHPEKVRAENLAAVRRYQLKNKEKVRAYQDVYWKSPRGREVERSKSARRRARFAGGGGSHTTEEWLLLCEAYGYTCAYCGADVTLVREHATPLSRGGTNSISNIRPACAVCNGEKATMTEKEFLAYRATGLRKRAA